jgi:RimJ/RimL family protein N-acetyltransferase
MHCNAVQSQTQFHMQHRLILETAKGPFALREEQPEDADFLYALFRSHTLPGLVAMPVDGAMKEMLLRMQFHSQATSYRAQYPDARFGILERDDIPFGRLIVQEHNGIATFVDFALLPENRGEGIGTAVIARVLDWVAERCPIVRLSVLSTNEASLRLTRRFGFIQIGQTPPYVHLEWHSPATT